MNLLTAGLIRWLDPDNREAASFLEHVSAILAQSDRENRDDELTFCEKKLILNAFGFDQRPYRAAYADVISVAENLARGGRERVGDLLTRVESLTGYGLHDPEVAACDLWLGDLLQGLADEAFRQYDWPRACRCVRALNHLNLVSGETARDYLAYFALHQLPDGALGYLGPDMPELFSERRGGISVDAIKLSITAEAVWTIAELATAGGWRLFKSLGEAGAR